LLSEQSDVKFYSLKSRWQLVYRESPYWKRITLVCYGRKNGLFLVSSRTQIKRINLYRLIELTKANNVEFYVYLKMAFNLLQQVEHIDDINALLLVHTKGMVD
jgi:hypothetical protein